MPISYLPSVIYLLNAYCTHHMLTNRTVCTSQCKAFAFTHRHCEVCIHCVFSACFFPYLSSFTLGNHQWASLHLVIMFSFLLPSWDHMLKSADDMLQRSVCSERIQVWPRQWLLRRLWREKLPWVRPSLCTVFSFASGILINLLDLLMDRNAHNTPLVVEISWQILLWIRGDGLIASLFLRHSVLPYSACQVFEVRNFKD